MKHHTPIQIPLPLEGETIEIPLTKGYVAIVDAIDADLTQYKWYAEKHAKAPYAIRSTYPNGDGTRVPERLHAVILQRKIGRTLNKGEMTDHINHNTMDNRRSNLRVASYQENSVNRALLSTNHSGYKGVRFRSRDNTFEAQISVNGVTTYLGRYKTAEEAYAIYCDAAKKQYGEFVYLPDIQLVKQITPRPIKRKIEGIVLDRGVPAEELIPRLLNEYGSAAQIAIDLGVHHSSVHLWLKRYGYRFIDGEWRKEAA